MHGDFPSNEQDTKRNSYHTHFGRLIYIYCFFFNILTLHHFFPFSSIESTTQRVTFPVTFHHPVTKSFHTILHIAPQKDTAERIAKTFRADDALEEAATGLRDGFSVGVKINEWKNEEGVLRIKSSTLQEVSLVTDPAIDSARVAEVAASETPENSEATAEETTTKENKVSEITSIVII